MAEQNGWTPTEGRFHELLRDGQEHRHEELFALLDDELSKPSAVNSILCHMRRKLKRQGLDVVCRAASGGGGRRQMYQMVRLLANY